MARYKKSYGGERRTVLIAVKLTRSERAELDAAAGVLGSTVSEHARTLLFRHAATTTSARRNPEAKALADELRAIGINLNQLCRQGHIMGELGERSEDLFKALIDLKAATARVIAL